MTATRPPCGDDCLLLEVGASASPLSPSARGEAAWVVDGRVVRVISAASQLSGHPFALPGENTGLEGRRRLLEVIAAARPDHVVPVTRVCRCSFEMPYLEATPLQDFGLGPDAGQLIHPAQRRISRPPEGLATALADLVAGLGGLHRAGVAHGDPAIMNALVDEGGAGVWIDLNSVRPGGEEAVAMDVAAFVTSCLWPALLDADHHSPSLFADVATAVAGAGDVLAALEEVLRRDRSDHRQGDADAAFLAVTRDSSPLDRDDLVGRTLRQVAATMAPSYFLDQTTSDMNARFFSAALVAERTRSRILDEERIRLHHLRFQAEADELRRWAADLQEAVSFHQTRAEETKREAAAEVEAARQQAAVAQQAAEEAAQRVARLEAETSRAQEALAASEGRAAAFAGRSAELADDLNDIYDSRAWRLITRMRRAKGVFRVRRRPAPAADAEPVAAATAITPAAAPVLPEAAAYPFLVSVIMPVFNKGGLILEALDSVAAQTLPGVEVVIWDDGSTDPETLRALHQAAARPGVSVFRAPNQGVIAARNAAMHFARGEFFSCLDPDDAIAPTYLEKAVTILRARPDLSLAYPWQRSEGDKEEVWETQDLDPSLIARVNHVPVCAVFRRRVFLDTGGFSPVMDSGYEDWELWAHAAELGHKGKVIPEQLFRYSYSGSVAHSRDAAARDAHLELAIRIGTLHPLLEPDRVGEIPDRPPGIAARLDLPAPVLPEGKGRPVLLMLPWLTTGGADIVVEQLARHWVEQGRTVVAVTTLELGRGMSNRIERLLAVTPYVYQLPALLPAELWPEFVTRLVVALPDAAVVNVGSRWFHEHAARLKETAPGLLVIDHHFNDLGHIEGNRLAGDAIDVTVTAHAALEPSFGGEGGPPVTTIYAGIDPVPLADEAEVEALRQRAGFRPGDRVAVFVGRLSEEKRPGWLPGLADALAKRHANLLVVGDGPLAEEVGPELERRENVSWLPAVDSVSAVYGLADLFVLPSRIEGIPLTVMEALSAGVPVIATAVGGLPELADIPGVHLADPEERSAFIDRVLEVLDAPEGTISLPERFHTSDMVRRYSELLDTGAP